MYINIFNAVTLSLYKRTNLTKKQMAYLGEK